METVCVFCKIIQGEIPCATLLDTPEVLAFLDISPVRPGHALVIPKEHAATVFDLSPTSATAVFAAIQRVGKGVMQTTGATGLNVLQNNFAASGQMVPHVHWHLIPRVEGDGLELWKQGSYAGMEEMQVLAKRIAEQCKIA